MLELVQSNEVANSNGMEREGLKRCVDAVKKEGLEVGTLVTDRHPQIQKMMREKYDGTDHYFDIWHVAKGFSKKAEAQAKQKDCDKIRPWIKSMVNHMHWSATTTPDGDRNIIEAKWRSLSNHIQDIHEGHGETYPACQHPPLNDYESRKKKFLKPDSKACTQIVEVINNTRLCKDVRRLSPYQQTSNIEAFNSLLLHWTPKMAAFGFHGMLIRQSLACLHYNENSERPQAKTTDGYVIVFPKAKKGDYTVRAVKEKATFKYIGMLFKGLYTEAITDVTFKTKFYMAVSVPPPLSASFEHPDKQEAVNKYQHHSRYSTGSMSFST